MIRFSFILLFFYCQLLSASDTLKIVTYNILNYNGTSRTEYLNTVVSSLDADIIIVQEMINQTSVDTFVQVVLENQYSTILFHDGTYTDNHLFYKSDKVQFIDDSYLSTNLRDIAEYELEVQESGERIFLYFAHLKASQGTDNEQQRLEEATILRNHLNNHPEGTLFAAVGDFNFYYSDEPGYQKLIASEADNAGQCFDPIDTPGDWHNEESFSGVHTQSPRLEQFGGGASGGLDDQFDFILISNVLGFNVLTDTYTEYGNDGQHFNMSINDGTNSVVISDIADALYYGSDHLPVYCDFVFSSASVIQHTSQKITENKINMVNYPNPCNSNTTFKISTEIDGQASIEIFDYLGAKMGTVFWGALIKGEYYFSYNLSSLSSGVYFYRLKVGNDCMLKRLLLIK